MGGEGGHIVGAAMKMAWLCLLLQCVHEGILDVGRKVNGLNVPPAAHLYCGTFLVCWVISNDISFSGRRLT